LHREQHQDVAELLQELKQLLISSRDPSTDTTVLQIERDLSVPAELGAKFTSELLKRIASITEEGVTAGAEASLSVKDGLEAFFSHFNGVRRYDRSAELLLTKLRSHTSQTLCPTFAL
jgi:hypothetical protein